MRLRLHSGELPGFRTWGAGSVVFSPVACETYFLDPVATEGFLCLSPDWLDAADYCATLAAKLDVDNDEVMSRYVGRLIIQFEESGFLESSAS